MLWCCSQPIRFSLQDIFLAPCQSAPQDVRVEQVFFELWFCLAVEVLESSGKVPKARPVAYEELFEPTQDTDFECKVRTDEHEIQFARFRVEQFGPVASRGANPHDVVVREANSAYELWL